MVVREGLSKYLQEYTGSLDVYNMTNDQRLRIMLRVIREKCPAEHPVKVHRINPDTSHLKKDKAHGTCWLVNANKPISKRYFLIEISNKASWSQITEYLFHEWAHALTWYVENKNDHGAQWAAAYGRLYRALIDD
jgi:hypothetical protein